MAVIYAHRGASGVCPENTMAAFTRAIQMGAHGIETDVQMSKDGVLVLCHDERLERTTDGRGLLAGHTWEELQRLDAGSWFDPSFAGERLPRLEDLFALAAGTKLLLNLELKSGVVLYPGIEAEVVALIKDYGLRERVIISSFNHFSLVAIKRLDPEIETGILYMEGLVDPWLYARHVGADALHPLFYGVRPEIVAGAHEAGLRVNAWTVDEPAQAKALIQAGVDGLITNHPDRLLSVPAG